MVSFRAWIQIFRRGIPNLSAYMGLHPPPTPRINSSTAFTDNFKFNDKLLPDLARLRRGRGPAISLETNNCIQMAGTRSSDCSAGKKEQREGTEQKVNLSLT